MRPLSLKPRIPILLLTGMSILVNACQQNDNSLTVSAQTCEYLVNPVGIETQSPRLSWQLISRENGQYQTAYQVMVASDPDLLEKNEPDAWNSGKVESPVSLNIKYQGVKLETVQRYWWKVMVWDRHGKV